MPPSEQAECVRDLVGDEEHVPLPLAGLGAMTVGGGDGVQSGRRTAGGGCGARGGERHAGGVAGGRSGARGGGAGGAGGVAQRGI